jgi:hypothetical protein
VSTLGGLNRLVQVLHSFPFLQYLEGIAVNLISSAIVAGLGLFFGLRYKKAERFKRIAQANADILKLLRDTLAERTIPPVDTLESLRFSIAKKHDLNPTEVSSLYEIKSDLISEVHTTSFLSAVQKQELSSYIQNSFPILNRDHTWVVSRRSYLLPSDDLLTTRKKAQIALKQEDQDIVARMKMDEQIKKREFTFRVFLQFLPIFALVLSLLTLGDQIFALFGVKLIDQIRNVESFSVIAPVVFFSGVAWLILTYIRTLRDD